jgi:sugar/nucleoside kinase (ribokinase family)
MQPGGSAANTAAWLGATGCPVTLCGSVGDDAPGATLRAALAGHGVELALRTVPDLPTGVCIVLVGADGERTMLPDRGANRMPATPADERLLPGTHLHLSGYALLDPDRAVHARALLAGARAAGLTTSVDCASAAPLAQGPEAFLAAIDGCDVLLANADEAAALGGAETMRRRAGVVVVKQGADGATLLSRDGEVHVPAEPVTVVDTTGAGDAFAAGFLPAWTARQQDADALRAGNRLAARAIGRVGAGPAPS